MAQQAKKSSTDNEINNKYLTFSMSEEEYGLPVLSISEVVKIEEVIHIPHSKDYFLGLMDIRNHAMPIVDLKRKLMIFGDTSAAKPERAIIIQIHGKKIALAVDSVSPHVMSFPPETIDPGPATVKNTSSMFITGVGKQGDRFVILLNLDNLFTAEEFSGLFQTHA